MPWVTKQPMQSADWLLKHSDRMITNPVFHSGNARALAEQEVGWLPRGELVMLPRAGHMAHFERPGEWNEAVETFLSRG